MLLIIHPHKKKSDLLCPPLGNGTLYRVNLKNGGGGGLNPPLPTPLYFGAMIIMCFQLFYSPPITVCWYIVVVNSSVPITNHTVTVATPIENCTNLINSSVEIAHTFNKTGKFAVVAEFRNNASSRSGIFQFSVGPGELTHRKL